MTISNWGAVASFDKITGFWISNTGRCHYKIPQTTRRNKNTVRRLEGAISFIISETFSLGVWLCDFSYPNLFRPLRAKHECRSTPSLAEKYFLNCLMNKTVCPTLTERTHSKLSGTVDQLGRSEIAWIDHCLNIYMHMYISICTYQYIHIQLFAKILSPWCLSVYNYI